eukprot:6492294-Amphidinium_carterae.1
MDALAHWRSKISLALVLEGRQDGRAITGLKKAKARKLKNDATRLIGLQLKSWCETVDACAKLAPKGFSATTETEINHALELIKEEKLVLPQAFKDSLFSRRVDRLKDDKDFTTLFSKPALAGLYDTPKQRMTSYKKHLFETVLANLILNGEEQRNHVLEISTIGLHEAETVDTVSLDGTGSATLDESCCIFHSLIAICTHSLDKSLVEL